MSLVKIQKVDFHNKAFTILITYTTTTENVGSFF